MTSPQRVGLYRWFLSLKKRRFRNTYAYQIVTVYTLNIIQF